MAKEETTEIVEKKEEPKTFSVALTERLNEVTDALPSDFNKARFVQNSLALINDTPALRQYKAPQIMAGLLKGAYLGTDFFNKECWLIPYSGDLQFQLSYKGEVKLAKKYSTRPIKDIYAKVVRQGDEFSEQIINGEPSITFKPLPFNSGQMIGAFAVCLFADGGMIYETMSNAELEMTKKQGMGNSPAYKNFPQEMAKKTVLKRLCKHIDIDFENPQQMQMYQDDMRIEPDAPAEVVDACADEIVIESEVVGE